MDRPAVTTDGAARRGASRASVTVGDVETTYFRTGTGEPVVLLGLGPNLEKEVVERLVGASARYRCIVPERTTLAALAPGPREECVLARWLSGFVQGLGLHRPHIVSTPAFRTALSLYERGAPGDLGLLVFLGGADSETDEIAQLVDGVEVPGG